MLCSLGDEARSPHLAPGWDNLSGIDTMPCPALPCPALPCPALPCAALRGLALAKRGLRRRGQTFRGLSHVSQPAPRFAADTLAVSVTTNGHRVLVVDDEPNIVDVVTMALRFQGFSVESAGTGAQALSAVAAFHPHLIVLDVMLPDMEGFDVAQRLGAQHARVPIIYLTARDATEDKIRGLTLGGDDYVTKPFSLEELVARIRVDPAPHRARPSPSPAGWSSRTSSSTRTPTRCAATAPWSTSLRPSTACCAT